MGVVAVARGSEADRTSDPAVNTPTNGENGPRPLVYIAGPYTHDDPVLNTRSAVQWGEAIEQEGCDVVIPHLSLLWHAISPAPLDRWYQRDLAVLARCDALVRFPGASTGADAEMTYAKARSIPVFVVDPQRGFWRVFREWRAAHSGRSGQ